MASLPPYSTFRTDSKQMMFPQATSHGNILTFTPPGFKQSLNVKFPDSRLAVCEKCKKNFKTRDMCRVRNTHTSAPWTTAYICLTLDESCTDANGKYVDKPLTVRMVQWQPYCVKEPFDPKTPVCAACKKTNRTRSFCRERHKHRQLPWCTVYVLLSALETADPSTVVAGPSKPIDASVKKEDSKEDSPLKEGEPKQAVSPSNVITPPDEASAAESKTSDSNEGEAVKPIPIKREDGEEDDDINDIAESRTFLAKVCCKSTTIHWLELAEVDGNDATSMPAMHQHPDTAMYGMVPGGPGMVPADPNHPQYYHHANVYAAQQHQQALKSHQQYFFQMQRHQHPYAASQAAWQAHYSQHQQPHVSMHGQPLTPPPAPPAGAPRDSDSPATPPVTAGEAAAQQQKRNREMVEERGQSPHHPTPMPPPPGHPHGAPPGPQGQQQQWMLYQQMYQAQLPPMAHAPHYPQGGRHMPPEDGRERGALMPREEPPHYNGPQSPNIKEQHESDSKRQRLA